MACFKLAFNVLLPVFALHLFTSQVLSGATEGQDLLDDINIYRKVFNLPELKELSKMSCLADEIADDLGGKDKCKELASYYPSPGSALKIPKFQENLKKCRIDYNTTTDGVIMPVRVPKLDEDALFSNYTKSNHFTKYLNDSNYTVAGVGSEHDWMVLILSTNSSSGNFSSATSLLAGANWKNQCLVLALFFSLLVSLII
ncbi:hypothetical protein HN51_028077 [Arachis hypogaea]|uniref:Uncharacterized GPI-anchored protein At3g06035-like n=1 Tax=Arachis duranensis TaxID=130453 RepID=A0A6P4C5C8_ARADU|nr:uncharacterized GPI-anchored protein At3g06035-like [Arachis duranensis]XP_025621580.1 uncharacterized GPI-anchored protein At3g06035 [Arachis hypogaea]QHO34531.1 putative GPI-anchored protein [Arachis hypogaea]